MLTRLSKKRELSHGNVAPPVTEFHCRPFGPKKNTEYCPRPHKNNKLLWHSLPMVVIKDKSETELKQHDFDVAYTHLQLVPEQSAVISDFIAL